MIVITKNGKTKKVSRDAFVNYYSNSGWVIAGEKSPATSHDYEEEEKAHENEEEPTDEENDVSDDEWDEVLKDEEIEKPLSEMNREELERKATSLGIVVTDMNVKQIREAIKKKM